VESLQRLIFRDLYLGTEGVVYVLIHVFTLCCVLTDVTGNVTVISNAHHFPGFHGV